MKLKSIKKWGSRFVVLMVILSVAAFFWADNEIDQFFGKNTQLVDYAQFNQPQQKLALTNVSVLSSDGEYMKPQHTVVIDAGRIIASGVDVPIPADAQVINAQGQYLIPGLVDSHVHLWESANDLLLYLANGVTHVREMNGTAIHLEWRQEVVDGRAGPDLFVATSRLNSNGLLKGWFDGWTAKIESIRSPDQAKNMVRYYAEQGYDAIKVYTFLENEHHQAISQEAAKIDMPVLGHLPISLGFENFWGGHQKELAHIEELVKELMREFGGYNTENATEFLQYVHSRKDQLTAQLIKHDMTVVSTLWLMESFVPQKLDLANTLKTIQLPYANPGLIEGTHPSVRVLGWLPDVNIYRIPEGLSPERLQKYKVYWETYAEANRILLRAMAAANVRVLAGTDANVPVTVPGFSMHDELQSMVAAGMSTAEALRSATSLPSDWMQIKSGRIVAGYRANLVLLNENPLDDIKNTAAIAAVIKDGRLYQQQQLNAMLEAVKAANEDSRTVPIAHHHHHH